MSPRPAPSAVLFDLDGTLLDTAMDMAAALNCLRQEQGQPALPFEQVRPHVSHGAPRLLKLAFGEPDGERLAILRKRFLDLYRANIAVHTRVFDGFDLVLEEIEAARMPWGIVTNKPGWLTLPLLEATGFSRRAACIISGDTLPERKPHPGQLLHAARLLNIEAGTCIYLGDAERDVQAARSAGMIPLVAGFGYLDVGDDPVAWQAEAILERPEELIGWLGL